jgi:drug efflux transport system permease protein
MRWTRFAAMARKELIQIRRDTRSLIIVLVMPVILVLLFGYGVSLDLKHLPVYVFDREGSQQSQELLKAFQATRYFTVAKTVNNYAELVAAIDNGRAKLGLVIPPDFSQQLMNGGTVSVQGIVDATDDNTANVTLGYAQSVVGGFAQNIQLEFLRRRGQANTQLSLSVETRTWYNEDLESSAFIVPGVLALVMAVIGAFLTSLTIAREWERGTMEQLVSTPVTSIEIMVGKLAPYFFIGMFDMAVVTSLALFWFKVPFRGEWISLFVASALFLVAVLCLGFTMSVVAKNQLAASQMALIATYLPAFLLSGFLFSIDQMPAVIRAITHIVPARYYVSALKEIFLKGTPTAMLYTELVPLAIFATLLALVATHAFHKRLV